MEPRTSGIATCTDLRLIYWKWWGRSSLPPAPTEAFPWFPEPNGITIRRRVRTMSDNVLQTLQHVIQDVIAPDVRELKVRLASLEKQSETQYNSLEKKSDTQYNSLRDLQEANFKALL